MDLRGLRSSDALDAYFQTDLMIDLSGDTITEDYGPLVLLSHCIPIIIAACFDKPFVLFGQTVGPFSWAKPFVLPLLKRSESIIARDAFTYHYLQSIGLKREQLVSSIDTAFMLKPHFSQRVDRLMRSFKLKPKKDLTIGMTISYQYQQFLKQRTGKEALKILPAVIDRFISEYDARLIFFPHVTGPGALLDDRKMASDVRQACRFKDRVAVLCDELSPQEIKALISKCDLFCGARMHSNIAASTSSVPTVSLSYSVKSRGIMARLGMADWVVEFDQLSTEYLYRTIQRLNAQRFSVSNCLKSISPQLSLKAESNVNVIKKILHQRRQR